MPETYRRSVFVGPRQIRIDEVPVPEPGPRQALVKVGACALCTWEQREYTGEEKLYPLAGGHEVAGELVAVGSQVFADAKIGDHVMGGPLTRCGYCESCRRGLDNICDNARKPFRSSDVPGPGGLSQYILLEDYQLFNGNNEVSYEELSLSEPLACAIRSVRKAHVERADRVVVVGAGIMGLLHLVLAKQAGASVIVSEPHPARAEFARRMGADAVINPTEGPFVDQVIAHTNGRGADVIFCAVSIAQAVEQSVEAAAKGGRVMVYASIHPRGSKITIDPNIFHGKEVVLTGTMSQSREDVAQAVRMISERRVDMRPFISATYPFDHLEEAFNAAMSLDTYRVIVCM